MVKAIMFDYDGVIVDSLEVSVEKDNLLLAYYGKKLRVTPESIRVHWGNGWRKLYTDLMGFTEDEIPQAMAIRRELGRSVRQPDVFSGMAEALTSLATRYSLYILSSSSVENIASVLATHDLANYFTKVFGQDTLGNIFKPDPEYILRPMAELGLGKDEAVSVGDSIDDIQMSHAAGVPIVACTWGWQARADLEHESPEAMVDSPSELVVAIDQFNLPTA